MVFVHSKKGFPTAELKKCMVFTKHLDYWINAAFCFVHSLNILYSFPPAWVLFISVLTLCFPSICSLSLPFSDFLTRCFCHHGLQLLDARRTKVCWLCLQPQLRVQNIERHPAVCVVCFWSWSLRSLPCHSLFYPSTTFLCVKHLQQGVGTSLNVSFVLYLPPPYSLCMCSEFHYIQPL